MGYQPKNATRPTLIYGYGSTTITVPNPQEPRAFQPIDAFVNEGAADVGGEVVTFSAVSMQGYFYAKAIDPPHKSMLHLDNVMDMNIQGNVNYNDYACCYAVTDNYDYVDDMRQFEITSTFYEGSNKSLLTVTDGATFTLLEPSERLGFVFHSAATNSNDMVVPYSRLYGWSAVR